MTLEKEKEICKKCNFKELRYNKETKQAEHFCIQENCFISILSYCPLIGK